MIRLPFSVGRLDLEVSEDDPIVWTTVLTTLLTVLDNREIEATSGVSRDAGAAISQD
jgi:hypothetical protein